MPDRIVVLGAGALSLGFFGPELRDQYDLTLIDTHLKSDLIERIQTRREYTTNLAGDDIQPIVVKDVDAFRLDMPDQDAAIRHHLSQARIFFTAVGIRNLDRALAYLFERLRTRTESIYILCAENGEGITEKWREKLPTNIRISDTVMGRMCRLEEHPAPLYTPVQPDLQWAVVAEDFFGMPLPDIHRDPDVFHSDAFLFVPQEEFHARDRIKLFAHNGLHFFIAVHGYLRGARHFSDLAADPQLTAAARELLENEIAPALWKDCAWRIGKEEFDAYIQRLPKRLFSPTLRDLIARGVRGVKDKFAPNERVIGGLRLLLDNRVQPNRYYDLLAAGLEVAKAQESPPVAQQIFDTLPDNLTKREVRTRWEKLSY